MGWPILKLSEVSEIGAGNSAPQKKEFFVEGIHPFIRTSDVGQIKFGSISDARDKLNDKGIEKLRLIPKGAILFPKSGASTFLNHRVILASDAYVSSHLATIKAHSDTINDRFLLFYLSTIKAQDLVQDHDYPSLRLSDLSQVEVPVPSLSEQKRIVAILDQAFADIDKARALTEQNLKNARELFESYLQQVFSQRGEGWSQRTLGELGKVSMCKRILKKQTSESGDIPFFKIGTFGKKPDAYISKDIYDDFRAKYSFPKTGDILISASGTIGRRVIYDGEPAYFQDSNIVWIDNDESLVLNDYLYHFYSICDWNPSKGATISRLYNDDLRAIKISFPSIQRQRELVNKITVLYPQVQDLQILYKKKLTALEELKKSLLQKAFSGELTKNKQEAA